MSNADRYYRVQQVSGRGGAAEGLGQAPDPQEAAGAFRSVAQAWLRRGEDASKIGAMLAALEVRRGKRVLERKLLKPPGRVARLLSCVVYEQGRDASINCFRSLYLFL